MRLRGCSMNLLRWLTQHEADTDERTHADLEPLRLAGRRGEALPLVWYEIERMPGWRVVSRDLKAYTLHAIRTRALAQVDDVTLRLVSIQGETWLHVRSASRGRGGDFGRNRRNILELFSRLRQAGIAAKESIPS